MNNIKDNIPKEIKSHVKNTEEYLRYWMHKIIK